MRFHLSRRSHAVQWHTNKTWKPLKNQTSILYGNFGRLELKIIKIISFLFFRTMHWVDINWRISGDCGQNSSVHATKPNQLQSRDSEPKGKSYQEKNLRKSLKILTVRSQYLCEREYNVLYTLQMKGMWESNKCLVSINVFQKWSCMAFYFQNRIIICVPQCPHSCICERYTYIPESVCRGPIMGYINHSQIHE